VTKTCNLARVTNLDWDDLRIVLALARERTLSDAATALGVTRTTVGRRVRDAERRLGVRFFDRTDDGFTPTTAGQDLVETAERLEAEVHLAEGRLLGHDARLRGRLRVSTVDFVFAGFAEVFAAFVRRYPHVDLTVGVTNAQVSLQRREADVAVRLGNAPSAGLVGRRVGRLRFALYGARSLVESLADPSPASLPWIHMDERSDGRWLDAWLRTHAPAATVSMRSDDHAVRRAAVLAGIGVHFLPCFEGDALGLVRVGAELDEERDLWLLTLPDLRSNSRVRAFMDHTAAAFAAHRSVVGEPPKARAKTRR